MFVQSIDAGFHSVIYNIGVYGLILFIIPSKHSSSCNEELTVTKSV